MFSEIVLRGALADYVTFLVWFVLVMDVYHPWYKEFLFTQIKTLLLKVWNLFTLNFLPNNSSSYPQNDSSNYINGKL